MMCLTCVLQLMIGNAKYQCSCVCYMAKMNTELIVGLSVGLALLLVVFVVIISTEIRRCRRRRQQEGEERSNSVSNESVHYNRRLPLEYEDYIRRSVRYSRTSLAAPHHQPYGRSAGLELL